jgi:hypothetical protein
MRNCHQTGAADFLHGQFAELAMVSLMAVVMVANFSQIDRDTARAPAPTTSALHSYYQELKKC